MISNPYFEILFRIPDHSDQIWISLSDSSLRDHRSISRSIVWRGVSSTWSSNVRSTVQFSQIEGSVPWNMEYRTERGGDCREPPTTNR